MAGTRRRVSRSIKTGTPTSSVPWQRKCAALRLGAESQVNGGQPLVDLEAFLSALTPEQRALLAAKISALTGPGTGPKKESPGPVRIPATASDWDFGTSRERATGLEPVTSSLGSWHSTN